MKTSDRSKSMVSVVVGATLSVSTMALLATSQASAAGVKVDAIIGTGIQSSASTDAIIGTGRTDAIIGTGKTDAIIGTGRTDAIIGTGKTDAIIGTGRTDAIIGTGIQSSASTDAIIGTGRTDAIIGTGKATNDSLVFLGPVQGFDAASSTVTVLGRKLRIPLSSLSDVVVRALAGGESTQLAIVGKLAKNGALASGSMRILLDTYVPGASPIVVSGVLKAIDQQRGRVRIGKVDADYTALLAGNHALPPLGSVVIAVGSQAQPSEPISLQNITTFDMR